MPLDDQDIQKIKAVVDAGHEQTRAYVDTQIKASEQRVIQEVHSVKEMLEEDHQAVVADVELLKSQVASLQTK